MAEKEMRFLEQLVRHVLGVPEDDDVNVTAATNALEDAYVELSKSRRQVAEVAAMLSDERAENESLRKELGVAQEALAGVAGLKRWFELHVE